MRRPVPNSAYRKDGKFYEKELPQSENLANRTDILRGLRGNCGKCRSRTKAGAASFNDFPIDIPQAVNEPGENIQPIKIEEIEGDIFARADAPVFDSVASVQSYARYMSFAETEKDIFNTGGEDGDAAAVLGDLSHNPALLELIKT